MIAGFRYVLWQKRTGLLAMALLIGATLSLVDALVGGLGGPRGVIELIPDSRYPISGPMPPRTEVLKDFVIDGQPRDGSIRLLPEAVFSGYWFGGSMWRGLLIVAPDAREGDVVISVKDRFGEKQNPSLVFTVKIWPDEAARQAHSASFITRATGMNSYLFVVGFALGGMAAGGAHYFCGRLWARHLRAHHCGEIYKMRRTERGWEVTCELPCGSLLRPGMEGAVYRPTGELVCPARIERCENGEVLMTVEAAEPVRLGDVACAFTKTSPPVAD